ncbi:sigma-70 family RNA polymerase sigma factor [Nitratireductor sp. StC3]|uniref:sigma-70 family RNA polymerase sigma factor n=1 Tax=Nitratireductor sp. StC3 TaxID=2126741 RepID=UPI000D0D7F88|nr:sigma-70 family RNA polymerase sigma factor [Nitratireductor sp. StC3]PSM18241.1 hypothetical protein C7T96_10250 [Nitratireductor sp. StC3]
MRVSQTYLSPVEEVALIRQAKAGDDHARDRIVLAFSRLAVSVARKYRTFGVPVEDLVSEGIIGLLTALDKFDPDRGNRFYTYAQWWVRAQILDCVFRQVGVVRGSSSADAKMRFFRGERSVMSVSMEARVGGDLTVADTLVCADPKPDELAETVIDGERRSAALDRALGRLQKRERAIIEARYLSDEKITLADLSPVIGVSRERIRQIEVKALAKVSKAMGAA